MKLLVVDYPGYAFPYDLSTELASRGHQVVHTYSASTTSTPRAGFAPVDGVTVEPVDIGRVFERYRPLRRLRDELSYGWRTVALARRHRPDRLLASQVPVFSLALLWSWAFVTRTKTVLWLQDMQAGLAGLVTGKQGFVARALGVLERFLIRRSPHVIVISEAFATELARIGIAEQRVTVIENWAPLDLLPLRPRHNAWSREHGLDDSFVFLYNGTLGVKHTPGLLKELAEEFADDGHVKVVVVAEGVGADWLREQPEPAPTVLPFQPFEVLPDVLATGDVLVALLDAAAGAFSVPSKTLSYLCAGRPILAAVPRENAAAQVVADRARAGVVVPPSDPLAVRLAARALYEHPDSGRAGVRARQYAQHAFDRRRIGDRFERLLTGSDGAGADAGAEQADA